ncbi:MAG: T9SS type A sorting domain-containing protein [Flavobacteriia bacterium]|nr:T9SS type A sorting domain-containing protein [Flavobacteriia bacterium]MBH2023834.1 T9SS type A sorting domain-containing protein [Flavobacteriales bacterium]
MKKKHLITVLFLLSILFSAQIIPENKDLMDQEINRYQRMIDFNVNPNTLNYDIQYQRMDVYLDPAVFQISGSVTSHFLTNQNMSSIYFDFTNVLPVSQVTYHGSSINFEQLGTKEIKIDLPTSLPANTLDSLTVHYAGTPDNSGRTSFYMGTHDGSPVLSTLSEPYGAQNWFPTKQSMNDKINRFDIKITTPSQYSVASNGKLMSETLLPDNKKLTFWRTNYPMAAYLVAFSIANFNKLNDVIGTTGFPFVNYLYPSTNANVGVMDNIEWTKTAMTLFENHFGPYPFSAEKYGHMEFAVNGAAMEHQTMSSMNSFARSTIAHELAHQWFGDKITCGAWNDIWLNEGFATFGEHLVNEKNLMTHSEFMNYLVNHLNIITSVPNGSVYVKDSDLGNIPVLFSGRLTYIKGGYILRMMKWVLGDEVFYQLLKDYAANPAFAYSYAKTEDFKSQILVSTGKDFTGFFNDWVYGQGYPTYTIKWKQSANNLDMNFLISQTQSDPSVNFFEMPLPVKVNGTNGETAYFVLDNTANNQFFTKPLNFQAASVELNYEYQVIEKNSTVVWDPALATENVSKDQISLFPNPVKNELNIKGISKVSRYEILGVDGKLVGKGEFRPSHTIDVSRLLPGIYLIKIGAKNLKFIKN